MSRLFDRIARGGLWIDNPRIIRAEDLEGLQSAEVFKADNVEDYYLAHGGDGGAAWRLDDFPNITPPFNDLFVEFKLSAHNEHAAGVYFHVDDLKAWPEHVVPFSPSGEAMDPEQVRWIVDATCILERLKGETPMVTTCYRIYVGPEGTVECAHSDGPLLGRVVQGYENMSAEGALWWFGRNLLYPALLTISLANCKNVEKVAHDPPTKVQRKHFKQYGGPMTSYYTLEIDPMKKVLRNEGGAEKTGLKQALHICRGHFKTYTDDKPLFGKRTGTYWWPQTVRGSKDRGEVVKDYAVKPGGGA